MRFRQGFGALGALAFMLGTLVMLATPASATHVVCGQVVTTSITLDSNLVGCTGDGLIVRASNVTIDLNGYRISGANGAGDNAGIRLAMVSGVTVKNGTVEGFDAGISIMGGGGNTVQNMTVQNNVNDYLSPPCDLGDGIAILNSSDNRIHDNQILNNGPYGGVSVIEDSDRNLISGNVVLGHNLRSPSGSGCGNTNQDEGIRIEGPGANDTVIENNRVEGSGLAGIGLHGFVCGDPDPEDNDAPNTGTVIRRNTVINNAQDGISFLQQGPAAIVCPAYGSIIERNIASNNGWDGIFVAYNSHDNTISHNVVSNNGDAGLRLNDPAVSNRFTNVGPTLFDLITPDLPPYLQGTDYQVMSGSGSGDVSAQVVAIDIRVNDVGGVNTNPVDTSTSGCELSDYTSNPEWNTGDIALIQRGTCTFVQKVNVAIAAGASAVVMFNEGQAGRQASGFGSVGPVPIPVLSASYQVGLQLDQAGTVTAHIVTNTTNEPVVVAPAPYNNTLIGNRGSGNGEVDGYDGNLEPPCDNNTWRASHFGSVNQPCVVGAGGSGTAKGRTGVRPGNPGHGQDVGTARGRSAGSTV